MDLFGIGTRGLHNVYFVGTAAPVDSASHDLYRPFLGVYREDASLARTPGGIDMGGTDTQRRILSQSVATGPNGSVFVNAQVVAFVDPAAAGTRLTAFDALGEVIAGYPRTWYIDAAPTQGFVTRIPAN